MNDKYELKNILKVVRMNKKIVNLTLLSYNGLLCRLYITWMRFYKLIDCVVMFIQILIFNVCVLWQKYMKWCSWIRVYEFKGVSGFPFERFG